MKTPIEHLRALSKVHRERVNKAAQVAKNMKAQAEAAKRAAETSGNETDVPGPKA